MLRLTSHALDPISRVEPLSLPHHNPCYHWPSSAPTDARNDVKFSELLTETITDAEIPLRFEPGAAEAVARPVIETLKVWIAAHDPSPANGDFEFGQKALVVQLLEELDDSVDLPVADAG